MHRKSLIINAYQIPNKCIPKKEQPPLFLFSSISLFPIPLYPYSIVLSIRHTRALPTKGSAEALPKLKVIVLRYKRVTLRFAKISIFGILKNSFFYGLHHLIFRVIPTRNVVRSVTYELFIKIYIVPITFASMHCTIVFECQYHTSHEFIKELEG